MSRVELEKAIIKSVTGPDETKHLLGSIDAAISSELEASDRLLLAEIEELEVALQQTKLELERKKAEADAWSSESTALKADINKLKAAFQRND